MASEWPNMSISKSANSSAASPFGLPFVIEADSSPHSSIVRDILYPMSWPLFSSDAKLCLEWNAATRRIIVNQEPSGVHGGSKSINIQSSTVYRRMCERETI